jgi:hypothetical protein
MIETEVKEYEKVMQLEMETMREKFETQEQLFSKFLKLMFEKYYHLESII